MKQKIKWFIASLMVMVSLQVGAQPEGKFYLYSSYKAFLSRAANGDATIDNFGIPMLPSRPMVKEATIVSK